MLTQAMDVLSAFPVRKSKKQKEAFRAQVQPYAESLGYQVQVEKGGFGAHNVVIGNPETAEYLVTAHYDTPAALPFPNLITPCSLPLFLLIRLSIMLVFFLLGAVAGFLGAGLDGGPDIIIGLVLILIGILQLLIIAGPANKSNANDNTSGVVTLLEIARNLPENLRCQVCFVLFDLEEAGLLGSSAYRKAHKAASETQIVLNLDCVGDGNEILFFPEKKLCKNQALLSGLVTCSGKWGDKSIAVCHTGFRTYPSDQRHFPLGVGIAALHRSKGGVLYCSRIHTKRDTVLDESNVNLLSANLISYIGRSQGGAI